MEKNDGSIVRRDAAVNKKPHVKLGNQTRPAINEVSLNVPLQLKDSSPCICM
jgi:hypothetical protein